MKKPEILIHTPEWIKALFIKALIRMMKLGSVRDIILYKELRDYLASSDFLPVEKTNA